jgi:hypothetical protein
VPLMCEGVWSYKKVLANFFRKLKASSTNLQSELYPRGLVRLIFNREYVKLGAGIPLIYMPENLIRDSFRLIFYGEFKKPLIKNFGLDLWKIFIIFIRHLRDNNGYV